MYKIIFFILLIKIAVAQNFTIQELWEKDIETNNITHIDEKGRDFVYDSKGNIIVATTSITIKQGSDIRIVKYDNSGIELWRKNIHHGGLEDVAKAIGIDKDDNIYIAGIVITKVNSNITLTKLNSSGDILWDIINSNKTDRNAPMDMMIDSNGNSFITGSFYTQNYMYDDLIIMKYDANGNFLWDYQYNGDGSEYTSQKGEKIVCGNEEDIYVIGTERFQDKHKHLIFKLDVNGNLDTLKQGIIYGNILGFTIDVDNNLYLSIISSFESNIIKFDNSLNVMWKIVELQNKNTCFNSRGSFYVDNNSNCYLAVPNENNEGVPAIHVTKYNINGEKQWNGSFIGEKELSLDAQSFTINGNGELFLLASEENNSIYYPAKDIVTVKFDTTGSILWKHYQYTYNLKPSYPEAIKYNSDTKSLTVLSSCTDYYTGLDIVLINLKDDGNVLWENKVEGEITSHDVPVKVLFDKNSNIYSLIKSTIRVTNSDSVKFYINVQDSLKKELVNININNKILNIYSISDMHVDEDGDIYITGSSLVDGVTNNVITAKFNSLGDLIWEKTLNSVEPNVEGKFISKDSSGNIIVLGGIYSGQVLYNMSKAVALLKYNDSGVMVWSLNIGLDDEYTYKPIDFHVDNKGDIYVLSQKKNLFFITKVSKNGEVKWENERGGYPRAIALDHNKNIYLTGGDGSDKWVTIKYDSSGTYCWTKENLGTEPYGDNSAYDILIDSNNNIIVIGSKATIVNFKLITLLELCKYDTAGKVIWTKKTKIKAYNLEVKNDIFDNIYVKNRTKIIKFDSNGNIEWEYMNKNFDVIADFDLIEDGTKLTMGGYITWYDGAYYLSATTSKIVKISLLKQDIGTIRISNTELSLNTFNLEQNYPNPFNPSTTISYQLPLLSKVELMIYNNLGQKIATLVNKQQAQGSYEVKWDASGFASGIYYYCLKTDKNFVQTKKLLLLK